MTFKAKVSGLSAFLHSTTVENSPSPSLRNTSYGPTHVSVSSWSAATDGGRASCWAQVDSRSVGLPVACSARGRIFLSILLMLGQLQWGWDRLHRQPRRRAWTLDGDVMFLAPGRAPLPAGRRDVRTQR